MNRISAISAIREKLSGGGVSVGSWLQIPHPSIAEIMGQSDYDWVAVDMEHGAISSHQLPDLFRALELGETLPLARLIQGGVNECKQALDAGAGGVIVPMVESAEQLELVRDACRWPSSGTRGVGFSRANLFGKYFDQYVEEAQAPLLVAMIEHVRAVDNLESILKVEGLDAILIGPYDLSASIGLTADFEHPEFIRLMKIICRKAESNNIASGVHVVKPYEGEIRRSIANGYRFIPYSIDAAFLVESCRNPIVS